jgi:hypothetical protein
MKSTGACPLSFSVPRSEKKTCRQMIPLRLWENRHALSKGHYGPEAPLGR